MRDVVKSQYGRQQNPGGRRRRRRRRNLSLYYAMIIILIAVVGVTLSLTVLFNISEIKVDGTTRYTSEQIIEAGGIKAGDNLIRTNLPKAEEKILKQLLYIDEVSIRRSFPNQLIITVTPSVPFAYVQYNKGYCLVSTSGKVLESDVQPDGNLVLLKGYEPQSVEAGEVLLSKDGNKDKLFNNISNEMEQYESLSINEIDITDRFNIVLLCGGRITVQLGSQVDLDYKLVYAKELITNHIPKNKEGTIFIRNNNEASFVEKEDLAAYEQNYMNAITANTENTTEKPLESGSEQQDETASQTASPVSE